MNCVYLLYVAFLIGVSAAASIETSNDNHINGENGWYVPQQDGSFEWMDMDTYESMNDLIEDNSEIELYGLDFNKVSFYLYTRENPTKPQEITESFKSINKSNYNKAYLTKFVIHGWLQSGHSGLNEEITSAWLSEGNYNIIVVSWARAHGEYIQAVSVLPKVGKKIASFIDYLVSKFELSLGNLEVIGHSLGAHVAGFTGKHVKSGQIFKIVGLDTAMPLFNYKNTNKRLSSDDAQYVETIHTNGGKLGFFKPIGKASFYPNGGRIQPGCDFDILGACSHERSVTYYAESVLYNNFPSVKCSTHTEAEKKDCGSTFSSVRMNSISNTVSAEGVFYVPVNSKSPHGLGEVRFA